MTRLFARHGGISTRILPLILAGSRLEKTLQFIQVTQQIFCPFVVNHSVLSKLYPPGGAVEQADA
ncbi:hypothetical protein SEEM1923_15624 [Salmonella enterica subsp. enterica serovar Miami str. 1923]|nr:hypothetical protein SEEM1923_15624 [Salmonella enterica subsp. enterica serovar Miami str. 1923]